MGKKRVASFPPRSQPVPAFFFLADQIKTHTRAEETGALHPAPPVQMSIIVLWVKGPLFRMCLLLIRSCQSKFPLMFRTASNALPLLANKGKRRWESHACRFFPSWQRSYSFCSGKSLNAGQRAASSSWKAAQNMRTQPHEGLVSMGEELTLNILLKAKPTPPQGE